MTRDMSAMLSSWQSLSLALCVMVSGMLNGWSVSVDKKDCIWALYVSWRGCRQTPFITGWTLRDGYRFPLTSSAVFHKLPAFY